jgi:hypothetical protein
MYNKEIEKILCYLTYGPPCIVRCAQCDGPHHLLSNEYKKIVQYRSDLKEQVNTAISTGKLHRLVPRERPQPMQFRMNQNEFPSLPSLMPRTTPWIQVSAHPLATTNMNGSEDITEMLLLINQNFLEIKENIHRINEKLDRINKKVNQIALDTELNYGTLEKLLSTLSLVVREFIWPLTYHNVAGLLNKQSQLQTYITSLNALLTH